MKKILIGILVLAVAAAAVLYFVFPGLPKYLYIKHKNPYPSLNTEFKEFNLSGVTVPDDFVEVKYDHGLSLKIAPDMKLKEGSSYTTYINEEKSKAVILIYNEVSAIDIDEQFDFATHEQIESFFKNQDTPVPDSEYEFLKFTHSLTYDNFNIHSLKDEKIFNKLAESKEELFETAKESYFLNSDGCCGFAECTGKTEDIIKYVVTLYTGENYENSFMVVIGSDDMELIKEIIASIKTEK